MPKNSHVHSILILGAGPIVIGQACEFDYAGTQACIALKEEGYRIILINSNPATLMTDLDLADATYIEPLTFEVVKTIIEKEKPEALLPTMGGQTALNLALELEEQGILKQFGVSLIGVHANTIAKAEDRRLFYETMQQKGIDTPKSILISNQEDILKGIAPIGFPLIVRSSFSLGGLHGGIANSFEELSLLCNSTFEIGGTLTFDEALIGWKEFELEVIRDKNDNCIVICGIENINPLGIHTGDSITVSPILTLTDKEYQRMRDIAFAVLRAVDLEAGGANVQFAVHPQSRRCVVIEMNPRVSRSSALASKATGFPIAKIAAKLSVGYTLDELTTEKTIPAALEPSLDYVVVKIPKFQFEKFPQVKDCLGPCMQSVGEVMAIGSSFTEALLKAMRSIEPMEIEDFNLEATSKQLWHIFIAYRLGMSAEMIHSITQIDLWFLYEIQKLVESEKNIPFSSEELLKLKKLGFSDSHISTLLKKGEKEVFTLRDKWGLQPVVKYIDGCSAELPSTLTYGYLTYESFCEATRSSVPTVVVIGSGPNCIGQGIEFDYSCVHALQSLKELGFETIMINCNPETISTDYEYADKLYCAPLTVEDLLPIIAFEKPYGVFLQYGGQLPLNLAQELENYNVPLLGLNAALIHLCENRVQFKSFIDSLQINQPESIIIHSPDDPLIHTPFPSIVRPSFILGGNGICIVHNLQELKTYLTKNPSYPLLLERYLINAIEVDVDAISDGLEVFIPTIMEQIEPAGIHSGDSAFCIPPIHLSEDIQTQIKCLTKKVALALQIKGFINLQFAIENSNIYLLEANPRASRTVPFLSKAIGINLVQIATQCAVGMALPPINLPPFSYFFVKEAVLPYAKFGAISLGPEMKATGEVMGIGTSYEEAYTKAQVAAGYTSDSLKGYEMRSLQEITSFSWTSHTLQPMNAFLLDCQDSN